MPTASNTDLTHYRSAVEMTKALIDIPSESFAESQLADLVTEFLRSAPHLLVTRHGNSVVGRTDFGHAERVVIAGHLDTVPVHDNLPHRVEDDRIYGLGATDMKGGLAVALRLAADVTAPQVDVTYAFYDCEEVASEHNGLGRLAAAAPELLACDFAVLMEPSDAQVEAGCQGSLRVDIRADGQRAHSARSWMGDNAIHNAAEILSRLTAYEPRVVVIDGLAYREGLNAVHVSGGVAGNVIPDECVVTVNYRYAPERSPQDAVAHVRDVFAGFPVEVVDNAAGALPGLSGALGGRLLELVGETSVKPKLGWTDVSRFAAMGVPAVNFGPGDPTLAHTRDEFVTTGQVERCYSILRQLLTTPPS